MKNGWLILWNAVAIHEMSKTSWHMGKLHMKEDSENHSKDQQFFLELWLNTTPFQCETNQVFTKISRKIYQESFLGMHIVRLENLDRRHSNSRY